MKKILVAGVLLSSLLLVSNNVNAQKMGGYKGPSKISVVTVMNAKELKDDTHVTLKGYIINKLEDEKYTFKDETGEIKVEIDNDKWNGLAVTDKDMVEIAGEVDKSLLKDTEIDVNTIKLAN